MRALTTNGLGRLTAAVRIVLGAVFVINGLNWWVKLIDPYPSISDFATQPPPNNIAGALIATGFLFHIVKGMELGAGVLLLANRFTPLALVLSMPVTVIVFFVDVVIATRLRPHLMGTGAMLMSIFLMLAYFRFFAPILAFRAPPDGPLATGETSAPPIRLGALNPHATRAGRMAVAGLGIVSLLLGLVMLVWLGVMIVQHFTATTGGFQASRHA